jgi:glucosamine--fructose-6-phosphate aminotransferase (isomerizing)
LSIAREAALKLKEISYIHAEAFAAGELKHGPLALIDSSKVLETPVILIMPNDENKEEMELALSEVHSRKALTIVITDNKQSIMSRNKINHCIEIDSTKTSSFSSLMCLIPLQLLTLEIAILKNLNVDKPRNLAKTVTVH